MLALTNSMNLIDGLDGLASGISALAAFALVVISLAVGGPAGCGISATAGTCA